MNAVKIIEFEISSRVYEMSYELNDGKKQQDPNYRYVYVSTYLTDHSTTCALRYFWFFNLVSFNVMSLHRLETGMAFAHTGKRQYQ